MAEAAPEVAEAITRESLFPEGWNKRVEQPEAASDQDEAVEAVDSEDLAEAQVGDEQGEDVTEVSEATLEKMSFNDYAKKSGITLEEAYRDIMFKVGDKEVNASQLIDNVRSLETAHEALLRERNELQQKAEQAAATMPTPGTSPEAQALMAQAQYYQNQLLNTDWSQFEPAVSANQRVDLQMVIGQLHNQAQVKQLEYQQAQQQQTDKAKAEVDRQTRSRVPEWSDAQVYRTEWANISDMLRPYGIEQHEIDGIPDARIRHFLRDAQKAMSNGKRIAEGAKKIRKVGKTLGAGSRSNAPAHPSKADVAKSIREAGSKQDAQKARLTADLSAFAK